MRLAVLLTAAVACERLAVASLAAPRRYLPDPDLGVSETLAQRAGDAGLRTCATSWRLLSRPARRSRSSARSPPRSTLADRDTPLALRLSRRIARASCAAVDARTESNIPVRQVNGHVIVADGVARGRREQPDVQLQCRRRASLNRNDGFPLHDLRPGPGPPGVPLLRPAGSEGATGRCRSTFPTAGRRSANGAEVERESRRRDGSRVRFAETQPISTYLFAFAAGKFFDRARPSATAARFGCSIARPTRPRWRAIATRSSICMPRRSPGSSATPGSPTRSASSTSCWCRRSSSAAWSIPAPSSTTPSGLMLDESATQDQMLGRASVIAHETTPHVVRRSRHDAVVFDDVWMKEVFANYMAAKIVNPVVSRRSITICGSCSPTIRPPTTSTAPPARNEIRQPLANLDDAGTLYGAIIYQKAPIVMRQLETLIGADGVPRRPAGVPEDVRVRQRDLAGSDRAARRPHAGGPGGVEPRVGRRARPPDDQDRADAVERPDRAAGLTQQDPYRRPRAALESAVPSARRSGGRAGRGAPRRRSRCRSSSMRRASTCGGARPAGGVRPRQRRRPRLRRAASRSASLPWLMAQPARHRRRADPRKRVGHAVGRDARRRGRAADALIVARRSARCRSSTTS